MLSILSRDPLIRTDQDFLGHSDIRGKEINDDLCIELKKKFLYILID
jgi:hypothetical protein